MPTSTRFALALALAAIPACGDDAPPSSEAGEGTGGEEDTDGVASDPDTFPGLSAPVEILIDDRGVPHIFGASDGDVMYADGYQMAAERLFQMDLMRRRALGRQAEVLGSDFKGQDELSRIVDFHRWGAANVERLREEDPDTHALIVAWLAGVNARIDEVVAGDAPLPYGFSSGELDYLPERWTLQDHAAIAKLMMFGNSSSLEEELLATIFQRNFPASFELIELPRPMYRVSTMPPTELPAQAPLPPGLHDAAPTPAPREPPIPATPAELAAGLRTLRAAMAHVPKVGSNNWAVDGRHTDTGRPYIAGDPHQPLDSPSVMYLHHLNSADAGGKLDVIGFSFAGAAGVHMGHNDRVHWTATTNFADVMDIWEVEIDPDGSRVKLGGEWVAVEERVETIEVAGGEAVEYLARDVPGYGVLLPATIVPIPIAAPGHELLLGWTGFKATAEESGFVGMNLAQSTDEFDSAVDLIEVGGFNFVSADVDSISYRVSIDVPDRGKPSSRQMPYVVVDGDDPDSLWGDFLPEHQLPRSHADDRGWIATANNDPWGFTFDGDLHNDPWYYGAFYAAGHRAKRLDDELTRLTDQGEVTRKQMQRLQTDTRSVLADTLLPSLEEAWAAVGQDEALAQFEGREDLQTLATLLVDDWERTMDRDSAGALAFHIWLHLLAEEVVGDEMSILFQTVMEASAPFILKLPALAVIGEYPRSEEVMQEGRDVLLLQALSRTAQVLETFYGSVDPSGYTWGDMHGTRFDNPYGERLDLGWVPTDGGEDTVDVSSSAFFGDAGVAERFDSTSGAVFRIVASFDPDGTPVAWVNFPPGNSGDPDSAHWDDTLDAWVEGEYQALPFTRFEIEAKAEATMTLAPAE